MDLTREIERMTWRRFRALVSLLPADSAFVAFAKDRQRYFLAEL